MLFAINSPADFGDVAPGSPGHVIRDKLYFCSNSLSKALFPEASGDLSPGPEPRHHFAAQGAFPAGKPRPRGRLCADRSHGNGPLYGVQLHRTVPGTSGRAGQRLDNLGADGVRIGGDRRKPMVFARL